MEGGAENLVGEGDRVAYHLSASHTGAMMGIPSTGKRITMPEMHIARVEGGKFAERWSEFDMMGMMQQLGVILLSRLSRLSLQQSIRGV
jgi:predicted ester cyclase